MLSILACSWLAGIASSSAISERPLPFPELWVLFSLAGHHPVLFPLRTRLHYCPALIRFAHPSGCLRRSVSLGRLAPPRFPGLPRYYAGLRLCPRRSGLPCFQGCAGRWGLRPARTGLPGFPVSLSHHATPPEHCVDSNGCPVRSPASLRRSGSDLAFRFLPFRCSLMEFTSVMACWFRRCPACRFGLAASSRSSLSVLNRLIRPVGLSPTWLPASPAHSRKRR